jgi:hypothetical protein
MIYIIEFSKKIKNKKDALNHLVLKCYILSNNSMYLYKSKLNLTHMYKLFFFFFLIITSNLLTQTNTSQHGV